MGLIAFFIYIAGLICFVVGALVSDMWIKSSFATLYNSVLIEKGLYQIETVSIDETPADDTEA
ncbi:MAG: hypothetical protein P1P83_04705 [Bacteroidales bacterium]|nr:hypothetical protein [Bacteroidales bacterium]